MDRISISKNLAKRNEIDPFLKRMVTGDEKWVTYDNIVRKRSCSKRGEAAQTGANPGLTSRMGQTLNLDIYCQQLDRLKLATDQKWPELANRRGVVFHQDNATLHTSVVTCQKLWELGWEVLMHPPYSSDLEPNDYHLFLALQNFLSDKKLGSREPLYTNRHGPEFVNAETGARILVRLKTRNVEELTDVKSAEAQVWEVRFQFRLRSHHLNEVQNYEVSPAVLILL
ncbi:histone-lysine N-methyltransferase SETMAR [Trichonephila clavipes]|nr:histone-lysine N-methyltransferase SETMAR [Trichonephila clavipes]